MNNVLERTAAATGVNRNIASKIHTINDVLNWKNKPDVPVATRKEPVILKNFSTFVRQIVCEMDLERKQSPMLDLILKRLKQKKVSEFENLNLFNGDEIVETSKRNLSKSYV